MRSRIPLLALAAAIALAAALLGWGVVMALRTSDMLDVVPIDLPAAAAAPTAPPAEAVGPPGVAPTPLPAGDDAWAPRGSADDQDGDLGD